MAIATPRHRVSAALHAMRPLFVYGTLCDPELFERVAGVTHAQAGARPARLGGFRRLHVRGENYPTLVRAPGLSSDGLLLGPLAEATLARLAAYEDDAYALAPVSVATAEGPVAASAFLTDPVLASARIWRLADWQRRAKPAALAALWA